MLRGDLFLSQFVIVCTVQNKPRLSMLIQDTVANQSTESKAIPTSEIPDDLMLRRISVLEYHEMIRAGILQSGDPVELLEGWLVEKMSKSPVHRIVTQRV